MKKTMMKKTAVKSKAKKKFNLANNKKKFEKVRMSMGK